ncbi:MAG: GDP-mannose 4,6-dehydratase [candidate division NC10 bacterium]|nr:GDP-mannose 4,6-dehydratase [candidate division NC10 bacterium]
MTASMWKQRRVLVTGCTGLLGAWLTAWLCRRQADVIGLVRDSVPRSNFYVMGLHNQVVCVRGAVEDFDLIERILNEYEIEVVFHLAAQTLVSIANENPRSTFSSNIAGTWNVLEAVRRARRVRAVVLASSDKAYGTQDKLPYREDTPLVGRHPYDVSKSCADLIAQMYWHTYTTPVAITRCGNFYGGGDLNFNRIVPGTIRSLFQGERPIIRSDGTLIRDYFYIKDAVDAYILVAEALLNSRAFGEAYNFSNELQVTVLELVSCIQRLMGREDLEPVILNDASNEIPHQYLDAEKARNQFGWKPRYTLEQGLRETIEWYREFVRDLPLRVDSG